MRSLGVLITVLKDAGNEDGVKHCAMNVLYSLGVGRRLPVRLPQSRASLTRV